MAEDQTYTLTLTTLTYGGEALGRLPDGRAVFVPFALPGERVRVRLVEEKRRHARAELLEVVSPAPERITPRCIHFGVCGGCHYQHMPYEAQLSGKTAILKDQLERIGGFTDPPIQPAVPSPKPWYYRNQVQFHLTEGGKLGYHKLRSEEVFPIQECHLPETPINELWPQLNFEPIESLERIGIRLGAEEDLLLVLESDEIEAPELTVEDLPVSAAHLSPAGTLVMAGRDYTVVEVLGRPLRVSAGSFFPANTPLAEVMVRHVLENLKLGPETTVVDAYCGAGLFSAFLAPQVGRLVGIEASPQAAEDFAVNLDEFDHVELYEAPPGEALLHLGLQPEVILVQPPRSGLDPAARDGILKINPETLVYVSGDPSTLARDARRLREGGYELKQVTPFDLFPQTYHIETLVLMSKK